MYIWTQRVAETLHRIEEHLAAIRNGSSTTAREWLTIQDVADELQVSRDTIERLIASGRLKAAEIRTPSGRGHRHRYRIRREWLEDFLLQSVALQYHPKQGRHRSSFRTAQRDFIG